MALWGSACRSSHTESALLASLQRGLTWPNACSKTSICPAQNHCTSADRLTEAFIRTCDQEKWVTEAEAWFPRSTVMRSGQLTQIPSTGQLPQPWSHDLEERR